MHDYWASCKSWQLLGLVSDVRGLVENFPEVGEQRMLGSRDSIRKPFASFLDAGFLAGCHSEVCGAPYMRTRVPEQPQRPL